MDDLVSFEKKGVNEINLSYKPNLKKNHYIDKLV